MEVILLKQIRGLGKVGDVVSVKAGFARNCLVPQEKALLASDANRKIFEQRKEELEAKQQEEMAIANALAEKVKQLKIELEARVTEEGALYGSIIAKDIVEAAAAQGVTLTNKEIDMPNGPIKELGTFEIHVDCHMDLIVPLSVTVTAQEEPQQ